MTTPVTTIGEVVSRIPLMVEDLAKSSGKVVEFVVHGNDTEVDRSPPRTSATSRRRTTRVHVE